MKLVLLFLISLCLISCSTPKPMAVTEEQPFRLIIKSVSLTDSQVGDELKKAAQGQGLNVTISKIFSVDVGPIDRLGSSLRVALITVSIQSKEDLTRVTQILAAIPLVEFVSIIDPKRRG